MLLNRDRLNTATLNSSINTKNQRTLIAQAAFSQGVDVSTVAIGQAQTATTTDVAAAVGYASLSANTSTVDHAVYRQQSITTTFIDVSGRTERYWSARITLDGDDISTFLTGVIEIEAEENTARIAELSFDPPRRPKINEWLGKPVTIDYLELDANGNIILQNRIFSGLVDTPEFDPTNQLVTLTCTDNYQSDLDAMSDAQVKALIPGIFSPEVLDPDAVGFELAQALLTTTPSSLEKNRFGQFVLSPWAVTSPRLTFDDNNIYDESIQIRITDLRSITNHVDIDIAYRYPQQKITSVSYQYGAPDLCDIARGQRLLPRDAVVNAANGLSFDVDGIGFVDAPASTTVQCPDTVRFNIDEATRKQLCAGFTVRASKRYTQDMVEVVRVSVTSPSSIASFGQIKTQDNLAIDTDEKEADNPVSEFSGIAGSSIGSSIGSSRSPQPPGIVDQYDQGLRDNAALSVIQQAKTKILGTHRNNQITFETPLNSTIELSDHAALTTASTEAVGKVGRMIHTLDLEQGFAQSKLTIFVSRTENNDITPSSDFNAPPPRPNTPELGVSTEVISVRTLVGGKNADKLPNTEGVSAYMFDLQPNQGGASFGTASLQLITPAIPEIELNEATFSVDSNYFIAIPNDHLILF